MSNDGIGKDGTQYSLTLFNRFVSNIKKSSDLNLMSTTKTPDKYMNVKRFHVCNKQKLLRGGSEIKV